MNTLSRAWLFDLSSIYGDSIESFPPDIVTGWFEKLSPAEQQRANTFTHPQRRLSYITSHALTYSLLETHFSKTSQQWQMASEGQPLLSHAEHMSNASTDLPNISLSHSGSWMLCAIADKNTLIGCDIETHKARVNIDAIAKSFFTEVEAQLLTNLHGTAKEQFFYRLWTGKEAWLKAQGLGIANGLKRIEFNVNTFSIIDDLTGDHNWQIFISAKDSYSIALAIQNKDSGGCNPPYEINYVAWDYISNDFKLTRSEVMAPVGAGHARDCNFGL